MSVNHTNDGSGNILRTDSLLPPHLWDEDFKKSLALALNTQPEKIKNHNDIGLFDVIITNPPFGTGQTHTLV